jgi:sodium transport system permease protein
MNWNNVKLIFARDMRDQLRDRRTLILIAVVPVLLYPLMGMTIFQLSQFLRNDAALVQVVGAEEISDIEWLPPLLDEEQFEPTLFDDPIERKHLRLVFLDVAEDAAPIEKVTLESAQHALADGKVQVVLYFPSGFGEHLELARQALLERAQIEGVVNENVLPGPEIFYKSANEKSRVANLRVERVLSRWRNGVMQTNLRAGQVPLNAARPFEVKPQDVSRKQQRQAALWSKILPFFLFLWALTGAFYPAVDVCAGEKERGTLETLLTSPAQRREIAWGKLLTVMTFSIFTALMNLGSLGLTGMFVLEQLNTMKSLTGENMLSLPPLTSLVWLAVALVPVAALFSALCLAFAAFARSTKEGQYYLMPLLVVIMPLMFLTMAPGVELTLGNSLIPITGLVLLLRSLIEGQYWLALPFVLPVVGVTLLCCLLAIRWVEELFSRESVLFRESERLELGRWLVHLVRDRGETPTFGQGLLCVAMIMVVQFFVSLALSARSSGGLDFPLFAQMTFITQVVCIALPAALMTLLFAGRPLKTLMLDHWPKASHVVVGALLAVLMFPLGLQFSVWVQQLYPFTPAVEEQVTALSAALAQAPYWWLPYLLIAVLPAFCEEIAFRGFVLSGLRHLGHKWWAIGLSAIAFGMVHFFLQQKISAAAVGMVIGYLAVQTGSLIPCIVFHALYNSLAITSARLEAIRSAESFADSPWNWLLQAEGETMFRLWVPVACLLGTTALLWWLHRLAYRRTEEEQLQEIRDRQQAGA